ncbi:MAG: hypothetical protein SV422_15705, partial [Pseudomonadota bacterium]|nr:hypothetical protein [Pseudomonadota bacterium]
MLTPLKLRTLLLCATLALLGSCGEAPPAVSNAATSAVDSSADSAQIAELRAKLDDLKARKQRIEDSNAIKRLQRAYAYY